MHNNLPSVSVLEFFIFPTPVVIRIHPKKMIKQLPIAGKVCITNVMLKNKLKTHKARLRQKIMHQNKKI